eukprot:g1490.t1
MISFAALLMLSQEIASFKVYKSYTEETGTKRWCASIENPHWPFAYAKDASQDRVVQADSIERKGRVMSNMQQLGHRCRTEGSLTKCFICEDISCGSDGDSMCHAQIQGMDWNHLPANVPTVSDTPWAVGGSHRNDFGSENVTSVCVILSGGHCVEPHGTDYSDCSVRCWGTDVRGPPSLTIHGGRSYDVPLAPSDQSAQMQTYPRPFPADGAPEGYPDGAYRDGVWFGGRELAWNYPKDPITNGLSGAYKQGRVGTIAGTGVPGYTEDGFGSDAKFNRPMGLAVDRGSNVFVADTANHCIRRVGHPNHFIGGDTFVTLLAGTPGESGSRDGPARGHAQFSSPQGIAVYYAVPNDVYSLVVVVADTGNHRIRKILNSNAGVDSAIVETLSGMKGTLQTHPFYPTRQGLADGSPEAARFNAPSDVAATPDGVVFVADKGNHVIREIQPDGTTTTLAGTVVASEEEPGCAAPCAKGVAGFSDGSLDDARFYSPESVAIGPDGTVLVVDGHSVRRVNRRNVPSVVQGVRSVNRVVTIAGHGPTLGEADGDGPTARFNNPRGVAMGADGHVYVADLANCRVRRISAARDTAKRVSCDARATDVLRPSGCASYDPPTDALFDKASSFAGNVEYNRGRNYSRRVMNCLGTPPLVTGLDSTGATLGPREGTEAVSASIDEDTGVDTIYRFECPPGCDTVSTSVWGDGPYTDDSSVCGAAAHAGAIPSLAEGGLVRLIVRRESADFVGTLGADGVVRSQSRSGPWTRTFSVEAYPEATVEVRTIAGAPSAPLSSPCGYRDDSVPQNAMFNKPADVAVYVNATLNDDHLHLLIVADERGHRIRTITSVCSKVCENGGRCVAEETCACASGWTGDDCTTPTCSDACPARHLCTGPDTCTCIPGFGGDDCSTALCVQSCGPNGRCVAPDTCACDMGWFDANCTTPVCSQTCGNGGNCTAPNTCVCAEGWTGDDCRTPICAQTCENGGVCVAPDTCRCPPQWSSHDCTDPVCNQGLFLPSDEAWGTAPSETESPTYWTQHTTCDYEAWCEATNGFDCGQSRRDVVDVDPSASCEYLELAIDAITPFVYSMTGSVESSTFMRESFPRPYGWDAGDEPWSAPGPATLDRQIAWTKRRRVRQGRYVCANGGQCVAFDTCRCAAGWVGFDCRVPVCNQGYFGHVPATRWHEKYPHWEGDSRGQGSYECSLRTYSEWESPVRSSPFEHVNFYSRFMDRPVAIASPPTRPGDGDLSVDRTTMDEPERAYWDLYPYDAGFAPTHRRVRGYGNHTNEGWRRDGWWETVPSSAWEKGTCDPLFRRTCGVAIDEVLASQIFPYDVHDADAPVPWSQLSDAAAGAKMLRIWNVSESPLMSDDPANVWTPSVVYTPFREIASGRWDVDGGECTDYVMRGCFNRGVCVGANVCACAEGWTGDDCSIPVCAQTCANRGNCTHPNTCTCERGWSGADCTVPLCAQECMHGGTCVAPDTCRCVTWPTAFENELGQPMFRLPSGDPMQTGWTGFDCNTPICVQALRFRRNTPEGEVRLGGRSAYLYGDDPLNNINVDPALDVVPLLESWNDDALMISIDNPLIARNFDPDRAVKPSYFPFLDVNWTQLRDALKDPFVFNVIAGNHDHNGNVSAQVAYSSLSARWSFPSLYYDFEKNIGGSTVHFVMIDTVILSGNSDVTSQETGEIVASLTGAELAERWSPSAVEQRVADDQWTWIESTLKDSKADFIIVAGHYPVYSICEHGPTPLLETKLVPLLETYRVTAFLNGHDHCAQHIDPGTGVDYHTIGSAHYNDKSTAHADAIPKDSLKFHATGAVGGFGKISVDNGSLVVEHLDGDGKTLYTAPARPSRSN